MVNLKEKTTAWREIIKSFWESSDKEENDNDEEYKQWEETNEEDVKASNETIKGLEKVTSASKNGGVSKKQRKTSETQTKSINSSSTNRKVKNRQRDDGEISR